MNNKSDIICKWLIINKVDYLDYEEIYDYINLYPNEMYYLIFLYNNYLNIAKLLEWIKNGKMIYYLENIKDEMSQINNEVYQKESLCFNEMINETFDNKILMKRMK